MYIAYTCSVIILISMWTIAHILICTLPNIHTCYLVCSRQTSTSESDQQTCTCTYSVYVNYLGNVLYMCPITCTYMYKQYMYITIFCQNLSCRCIPYFEGIIIGTTDNLIPSKLEACHLTDNQIARMHIIF